LQGSRSRSLRVAVLWTARFSLNHWSWLDRCWLIRSRNIPRVRGSNWIGAGEHKGMTETGLVGK